MIEIRKISYTSLLSFFILNSSGIFAKVSHETSSLSKTELKSQSELLKNTKLSSYFQTTYIDLDSMANKGNLFTVETVFDLEHQLSKNVDFRFEAGGAFEKGNSDSLFDNSPIEAQSRLLFKRAEFKWEPSSNIKLLAGSIYLQDFDQPILLSHRGSLLGTKQVINAYLADQLNIEFSALQAIPNNSNFSNRLDQVDEGNPEFYLETLGLTYGDARNFLKLKASHYAFDNLSNSSAAVSRYIGNSTYVFDKDNAEFIYSYQGWTQNISFQYENSSMIIKPFANFVENTAAPEKNKAHLFGLSGSYLKGDKMFTLIATTFRTEADAAVAYYQSKAFFHVNHTGESLSLVYNDNSENLMIKLVLGHMKEIDVNQLSSQDESHAAVLLFRKSYELF